MMKTNAAKIRDTEYIILAWAGLVVVMSCVCICQRCVTVLILTISRTAAARRTVLRYCTSLKSTVLVDIIRRFPDGGLLRYRK